MRIVTFSFDDGHEHDAEVIRILDGRPATFYISTLARAHCSTGIDKLDAKIYSGHEIGNHTRFHAHAYELDAVRLSREIVDAGDELAEWCGVQPVAFSYPWGQATLPAVNLLEASGYKVGRLFCIEAENAAIVPEPLLLPLTDYCDRGEPKWDMLARLASENKAMCFAGHAWAMKNIGRLRVFSELVEWFTRAGYEFQTNTDYVRRVISAR